MIRSFRKVNGSHHIFASLVVAAGECSSRQSPHQQQAAARRSSSNENAGCKVFPVPELPIKKVLYESESRIGRDVDDNNVQESSSLAMKEARLHINDPCFNKGSNNKNRARYNVTQPKAITDYVFNLKLQLRLWHESASEETTRTLQHSIAFAIRQLADVGDYDKAHEFLDQIHTETPTLVHIRMYCPLMKAKNAKQIFDQLLRHNVPIDRDALHMLSTIASGHERRLVALEKQQGSSWTIPMYLKLIHTVWAAQAKKYFKEHILPTENKNWIRYAVEIILWKYKVIASKIPNPKSYEIRDNAAIAQRLYESYADKYKGKATFLMMEIFCFARNYNLVERLANTQPHPWTPAMYGLLIKVNAVVSLNHSMYWFHRMIKECPNPGGVTVMLKIIKDDSNKEYLETVHSMLKKGAVTPDARVADALLQCYGELGDISTMLEILRSYRHILDVGHYEAALKYTKGSPEVTMDIVDMMLEPTTDGDVLSTMSNSRWTSFLDTLAALESEESAKRVHELVEKYLPNSVIAWTTAIKAWGASDAPAAGSRIWEIYESLRSTEPALSLDKTFYTALLFHLCRTHDELAFHRAWEALRRMETTGSPAPDANHYDPIFEACLARSLLKEAREQIQHRMQLLFDGTNPEARPQRSSFRHFVGAWIRSGKDLRPLTKLVNEWTDLYQKHGKGEFGPDLIVYEMLFVGWDRESLRNPERYVYMRKIEHAIMHRIRQGDEEDQDRLTQ